MDLFYILDPIPSIYERIVQAGHTAKIYYYDQQSSTMEIVNLLKNQPQIFGSYSQFRDGRNIQFRPPRRARARGACLALYSERNGCTWP
jgi:hypothetical protein